MVLGGAGFLGHSLVAALIADGCEVSVVDRNPCDGPYTSVCADIEEIDLGDLIGEVRPEVVFHLANTSSVPASWSAPLADLAGNLGTTVRVLEALRALAAPPRLVFVSSAAVYGESVTIPMDEDHPRHPISPYGASKTAAEEYVRLYASAHGIRACCARPFSIYGPGQRKQVVYDLLRRLQGGEDPLEIQGDRKLSRDFVWIGDATRALIQLGERADGTGDAYNVASGRETTLETLVDLLVKVAGRETEVVFTGEVRAGDPRRWAGDPGRLARLGAVCDTPLERGLQLTWDWLQSDHG